MDQVTAINTLKKEVNNNPVARDVMHVFAQRQRARHMVTLRALNQKMEQEGFDHPKGEYAKVLSILADCGFGKLEKDRRGDVTALVEVKATLQSLGAAVLGQKRKLDAFRKRNTYRDVVTVSEAIKKAPQQLVVYPYRATSTVSITLTINGKPIILPLPGGLSPQEIAEVIAHFQRTGSTGSSTPEQPSSTGKESS